MKSFIVLGVLLALASCGKDNGSSSSSKSFASKLSSSGVDIQSNGMAVIVTCTQTNTSNQARLQYLQGYISQLQSSSTMYVTMNGIQMDKYRVISVLNQASYVLQQSAYGQGGYNQNPYYQQNPYYNQNPYYQQNPYQSMNTMCPAQVLAQG